MVKDKEDLLRLNGSSKAQKLMCCPIANVLKIAVMADGLPLEKDEAEGETEQLLQFKETAEEVRSLVFQQ